MLGLVDTTMEAMEREQGDNITKQGLNNNKGRNLRIAMMAVVAVIAIILISVINVSNSKKMSKTIKKSDDIVVSECENEDIKSFIHDFFKAKEDTNYPKIFASYGRDYYSEERDNNDGAFDKIIARLKYEKNFVTSYDDIHIYTCDGLYDNEVVAIVTYDLNLGFTESKAPMILLFYLENGGEGYIIKDKLDIGTSKYIVEVSNTEFVRNLYNDVTSRLRSAMDRSESLRLSYNSLRQFEINQNVDLDNVYNNGDNLNIPSMLSPLTDGDEYFKSIKEIDRKKKAKENIDRYFGSAKASMSEVVE
ncbi:MAG: hypothetical protein IJT67_01950 [Lachnospiraceae bacterium]|nr:hypothetical protein [Lachnospiraceae bacterium]